MSFLPGIISGVATGIGALGTLFGSGQKRVETQPVPQQVLDIFEMLQSRATQGIGVETRKALGEMLNRRIGNEFGALTALTRQRLGRQGASAGTMNAALSRVGAQRGEALGQGLLGIAGLDEQAKQSALSAMPTLAPFLRPGYETVNYGGGFADLFGQGLYGLTRPGPPELNFEFQTPNIPPLDYNKTFSDLTRFFGGTGQNPGMYSPGFNLHEGSRRLTP